MTLVLLLFAALAAGGCAWLAGPPWWAARRRARVLRQPFPAAWRAILRRGMPAYARLPAPLQREMRGHVQLLLAEKAFIGCAGQAIDDRVRVLVAAQAALLLLNRGGHGWFAGLRQILVYPGAFVVDRIRRDALGLEHGDSRVLAGESWQLGQVVLSWDDVLAGAADPDDGRNVVIHEFAHQLDQQHGGVANGGPWLPRARRARWAAVLAAAHVALQTRVAAGQPGVLDAYGATDAAEFFAVASEAYFERAHDLAAEQPALYAELAAYYRVDPRAWR